MLNAYLEASWIIFFMVFITPIHLLLSWFLFLCLSAHYQPLSLPPTTTPPLLHCPLPASPLVWMGPLLSSNLEMIFKALLQSRMWGHSFLFLISHFTSLSSPLHFTTLFPHISFLHLIQLPPPPLPLPPTLSPSASISFLSSHTPFLSFLATIYLYLKWFHFLPTDPHSVFALSRSLPPLFSSFTPFPLLPFNTHPRPPLFFLPHTTYLFISFVAVFFTCPLNKTLQRGEIEFFLHVLTHFVFAHVWVCLFLRCGCAGVVILYDSSSQKPCSVSIP